MSAYDKIDRMLWLAKSSLPQDEQILKDAAKAIRILDLVVAEWKSDPTSVACFDLDAIVRPAMALME